MTPANESSENLGRKKGLVVGISTYKDRVSHPFCEKNGLDMYDAIKSEGYEIRPKNRLIGQVKEELIRKETIHIFANAKSEDTILFYYSGQVFLNAQGSVYLGSSDTNPTIPYEGGISFSDLIYILEQSHSNGIIVLVDCFIGTREKTDEKEDSNLELVSSDIKRKFDKLSNPGRILLASIQHNQEAATLLSEGNSIFTHYLILGLHSNDRSKQPVSITSETLGNFVFQQLKNLPKEKKPSHSPIILTQSSRELIIVNRDKEAQYSESKFEDFDSLLNDGNGHFSRRNFEKAAICYDKAIMLDRNNPIVWYKKGNALCEITKYDEAIKCYDKAIELNPNNADAYNNKGTAFFDTGKYDEAIKCYDKALESNRDDGVTYYNKGNALCEITKYDEAIKCYDKAIELNPNNADAHNNKAFVLFKLLKLKEAKESLKRARSLSK